MADDFLIGIDLGGTKIAAAAFDPEGNRLGKIARLPTMADRPAGVTLLNLKRVVKQAKAEAGVAGQPRAVGMGSSGPLDPQARILRDRDSLPNLDGFRIGKFVEEEIGARLYLENDAACFALGEAIQGAGRSKAIVLGVTLGTGFGCGVVIGRKIYSGATNNAGEVAYCRGEESCFDHACSGSGVVEQYRRQFPQEPAEMPDARQIGELAAQGDGAALRAWAAYGGAVGTAIGTVCCVLDPELVVVGGSIGSRLAFFREPLREAARAILPAGAREAFRVEASSLGDAAGLTGAIEYARQELGLEGAP